MDNNSDLFERNPFMLHWLKTIVEKNDISMLKDVFVNFLIKKNALYSFCYYFEERTERLDKHVKRKTFDEFISAMPPRSYFLTAFDWEATLQGAVFWSHLSMDWTDFCSQVIINIQNKYGKW